MTEPGIFEAIEGKTNISVAHEAHARAVEKIKELGSALEAEFDRLVEAQDRLSEFGITTAVDFKPPISWAWGEYALAKDSKAQAQGQETRRMPRGGEVA